MGGVNFLIKSCFFSCICYFVYIISYIVMKKGSLLSHIISEIIPILGGFATLSNFCSLC